MDLLTISPVESADMKLCHPVTGSEITGSDGLPVVFKVAGADSSVFRKANHALTNARIGRKKSEDFDAAAAAEADGVKLVASCILGWSGNFSLGAKPIYSAEKALEIISTYPWIREQVDSFIGKRANFLPKG